MGEVEALLRLKECPGLGDRRITDMVKAEGSGVAALRAATAQGQIFPRREEHLDVASWKDRGITTLPITSAGYPSSLLALADPPPLLFLRGRAELLVEPSVAVVGSRRATEGGRETAEALGRVLASTGITVVSGMARGIDGAAHKGAMAVGGNTIAVLGSGLEVIYPPSHRGLFREIARTGLLVSEFLPSERALPHHFPKRNRVIAGLVRAIVVVEAGERSGALITVDHGLDLGREILAVPGSLWNPQARGTNALIRDGARLLSSPEAVLDELGTVVDEARARNTTTDSSSGRDSAPREARFLPPRLTSDPVLESLWLALGPEPRGVDALAERAGIPPAEALAGLSSLELLGHARRMPGMRFRRE